MSFPLRNRPWYGITSRGGLISLTDTPYLLIFLPTITSATLQTTIASLQDQIQQLQDSHKTNPFWQPFFVTSASLETLCLQQQQHEPLLRKSLFVPPLLYQFTSEFQPFHTISPGEIPLICDYLDNICKLFNIPQSNNTIRWVVVNDQSEVFGSFSYDNSRSLVDLIRWSIQYADLSNSPPSQAFQRPNINHSSAATPFNPIFPQQSPQPDHQYQSISYHHANNKPHRSHDHQYTATMSDNPVPSVHASSQLSALPSTGDSPTPSTPCRSPFFLGTYSDIVPIFELVSRISLYFPELLPSTNPEHNFLNNELAAITTLRLYFFIDVIRNSPGFSPLKQYTIILYALSILAIACVRLTIPIAPNPQDPQQKFIPIHSTLLHNEFLTFASTDKIFRKYISFRNNDTLWSYVPPISKGVFILFAENLSKQVFALKTTLHPLLSTPINLSHELVGCHRTESLLPPWSTDRALKALTTTFECSLPRKYDSSLAAQYSSLQLPVNLKQEEYATHLLKYCQSFFSTITNNLREPLLASIPMYHGHPSFPLVEKVRIGAKNTMFSTNYISGGNFYASLAFNSRLMFQQSWDIAHQIVTSLDYLHDVGIAHLDIKPENLFVEIINGRVVVKIGDLGLSQPGNYTFSDPSEHEYIIATTFCISNKLCGLNSLDTLTKDSILRNVLPPLSLKYSNTRFLDRNATFHEYVDSIEVHLPQSRKPTTYSYRKYCKRYPSQSILRNEDASRLAAIPSDPSSSSGNNLLAAYIRQNVDNIDTQFSTAYNSPPPPRTKFVRYVLDEIAKNVSPTEIRIEIKLVDSAFSHPRFFSVISDLLPPPHLQYHQPIGTYTWMAPEVLNIALSHQLQLYQQKYQSLQQQLRETLQPEEQQSLAQELSSLGNMIHHYQIKILPKNSHLSSFLSPSGCFNEFKADSFSLGLTLFFTLHGRPLTDCFSLYQYLHTNHTTNANATHNSQQVFNNTSTDTLQYRTSLQSAEQVIQSRSSEAKLDAFYLHLHENQKQHSLHNNQYSTGLGQSTVELCRNTRPLFHFQKSAHPPVISGWINKQSFLRIYPRHVYELLDGLFDPDPERRLSIHEAARWFEKPSALGHVYDNFRAQLPRILYIDLPSLNHAQICVYTDLLITFYQSCTPGQLKKLTDMVKRCRDELEHQISWFQINNHQLHIPLCCHFMDTSTSYGKIHHCVALEGLGVVGFFYAHFVSVKSVAMAAAASLPTTLHQQPHPTNSDSPSTGLKLLRQFSAKDVQHLQAFASSCAELYTTIFDKKHIAAILSPNLQQIQTPKNRHIHAFCTRYNETSERITNFTIQLFVTYCFVRHTLNSPNQPTFLLCNSTTDEVLRFVLMDQIADLLSQLATTSSDIVTKLRIPDLISTFVLNRYFSVSETTQQAELVDLPEKTALNFFKIAAVIYSHRYISCFTYDAETKEKQNMMRELAERVPILSHINTFYLLQTHQTHTPEPIASTPSPTPTSPTPISEALELTLELLPTLFSTATFAALHSLVLPLAVPLDCYQPGQLDVQTPLDIDKYHDFSQSDEYQDLLKDYTALCKALLDDFSIDRFIAHLQLYAYALQSSQHKFSFSQQSPTDPIISLLRDWTQCFIYIQHTTQIDTSSYIATFQHIIQLRSTPRELNFPLFSLQLYTKPTPAVETSNIELQTNQPPAFMIPFDIFPAAFPKVSPQAVTPPQVVTLPQGLSFALSTFVHQFVLSPALSKLQGNPPEIFPTFHPCTFASQSLSDHTNVTQFTSDPLNRPPEPTAATLTQFYTELEIERFRSNPLLIHHIFFTRFYPVHNKGKTDMILGKKEEMLLKDFTKPPFPLLATIVLPFLPLSLTYLSPLPGHQQLLMFTPTELLLVPFLLRNYNLSPALQSIIKCHFIWCRSLHVRELAWCDKFQVSEGKLNTQGSEVMCQMVLFVTILLHIMRRLSCQSSLGFISTSRLQFPHQKAVDYPESIDLPVELKMESNITTVQVNAHYFAHIQPSSWNSRISTVVGDVSSNQSWHPPYPQQYAPNMTSLYHKLLHNVLLGFIEGPTLLSNGIQHVMLPWILSNTKLHSIIKSNLTTPQSGSHPYIDIQLVMVEYCIELFRDSIQNDDKFEQCTIAPPLDQSFDDWLALPELFDVNFCIPAQIENQTVMPIYLPIAPPASVPQTSCDVNILKQYLLNSIQEDNGREVFQLEYLSRMLSELATQK